jgi:hypothetical protein
MDLILQNPSLLAQSEDSLYELISSHFEQDSIWFHLLSVSFRAFNISSNGQTISLLNYLQEFDREFAHDLRWTVATDCDLTFEQQFAAMNCFCDFEIGSSLCT